MTCIAILTTVHARTDVRIRVKQAPTLAKGLKQPIKFFVQDGQGTELPGADGIEIVDTGSITGGRLGRMTRGVWRMYCAVRQTRPYVVHLHDPELLIAGLALKLLGAKVIYDVHEDVPRQILGKNWLAPWLRRPAAWVTAGTEWLAAQFVDGIVAATPLIARRFPARKTVTVENFPLLSELMLPETTPYHERPLHFAYLGGLTANRGVVEMVNAMAELGYNSACLQLAGNFRTGVWRDQVTQLPGWQHVKYHGWVNRSRAIELLGNARAGLVVLHPIINYIDAYPVKLFEYMAAGLPVIASDFPVWREIIDNAGCGILVDPLDHKAIADAMRWLLEHPAEAQAMGERGRAMIVDRYNWESIAARLVCHYTSILGGDSPVAFGEKDPYKNLL